MSQEIKEIRLLLALLYPVMYDEDLLKGADKVMETVVEARVLDGSPEQYLNALQRTLASQETLTEKFANLLPRPRSEQAIREFFEEIERRLIEEIKKEG